MNRERLLLISLGLAAVIALLVTVVPLVKYHLGWFLWVSELANEVREKEALLQKPEIYEPVGKALALYCQSDQTYIPDTLTYPWLPLELRAVGEGSGDVTTNAAHVEMGGGFHHFGYVLVHDEQGSTAASNVWKLNFYTEYGHRTPLKQFALAVTNRMDSDEMLALAVRGFEREISKNPDNQALRQAKVLLFLRFKRVNDAAKACKEWIEAYPDRALPRVTYAHLRSRLGEGEAAVVELETWVKEHQSFVHYHRLALFHLREGRSDAALEAVRAALNEPSPPLTKDDNSIFYGYDGAVLAFMLQDYETCALMCDKMLAVNRDNKWQLRRALKLRAAAEYMTGYQAPDLEQVRQAQAALDRSPFSGDEEKVKNDNEFLAAIQNKNTDFVKDCRNWVDELDAWSNPYETDEAGWHGRTDIPTPYPQTWKTDKMRLTNLGIEK